jgi:mRNA-degrading endonuclease RelE of RelBE toxin-antitoxin system
MSSVETADLEQIVLTIQRESERLRGGRRQFRLGGFHRLAFLVLRVVAYSIPIAVALLLLGVTLLGWGGSLQALVLVAWLIISFFLLPILILLNLPLIVAAWRQRRPIVKRDLLMPVLPPWQRKARWGVLGLTVVAAILATTIEEIGWGGFILFLVVVVLPFLLLMMQSFLGLVERNLDLLRSVEELQGVLEGKLEEARRQSHEQVEIPHAIAVELAETTEGFLRNERLRAIDESMRQRSKEYSVVQSGAYRQSLQSLEPETRLQLAEQTRLLSENRRPPEAHRAEEGDHWIFPVSALGMELVYEIVDERRQVMVLDVRPVAPTGEAGANGPG